MGIYQLRESPRDWDAFCVQGQHYNVLIGLKIAWAKSQAASLTGEKDFIQLVKKSVLHQHPESKITITINPLNSTIVADRPNEGWPDNHLRVFRSSKIHVPLNPVQWHPCDPNVK